MSRRVTRRLRHVSGSKGQRHKRLFGPYAGSGHTIRHNPNENRCAARSVLTAMAAKGMPCAGLLPLTKQSRPIRYCVNHHVLRLSAAKRRRLGVLGPMNPVILVL
jgi:hypothetical protein